MTGAGSGAENREPGAGLAGGSDRVYFLGIVSLTFVFLAIAGYPRQWTLGLLINDEFWYAHLARSLYDGIGYMTSAMYPMQAPQFDGLPVPEAMKQPGYSLVSALAWQITGVSVRAMLVIANAGLSLLAGLAFLLARQLGWGRGAAMFVAGATVVNPLVAQDGVQALPESLYFACFILTVLLLMSGNRAGTIGAGVANAALMIIKGHGIIYIPVFAAFLWLRGGDGLRDAIRPNAGKARSVGMYCGALFATLILAAIVLPSGSVQIFEASGSYSHAFLIEVGRETSSLAYLETAPPDPVTYILEHPGQYLDKLARQVRRTKIIVDDLGGPAFNGILFPGVLLSMFLLLGSVAVPETLLPAPRSRREIEPYLLFAATIAMTFAFFWPIHLVTRFITQLTPLMLLLCLYVLARLGTLIAGPPRLLARSLAIGAIGYFVVYPAAVTVWQSYRHPMQHIGSLLAVRYLDYGQMSDNVNTLLPRDPVLVADMGHEITWTTGARTILFPNTESDLEYLIERYDVDALYEHPLFPRDWSLIRERFTLIDDDNGFLWVRRRDR